MRPGFKMPAGSKADFNCREIVPMPASNGWKTSTAARTSGAARMRVAWPPCVAMTRRTSAAPASVVGSISSQISPPAQS